MAEKSGDGVAAEVKLENKWVGSATIRASGLYGGAAICLFVLLLVFLVGDYKHPPHYFLSLLAAFLAGVFFVTIVADGRVKAALALVEEKRQEIARITAIKAELEAKFVEHRLSSASLPPASSSSQDAPASSKASNRKQARKK